MQLEACSAPGAADGRFAPGGDAAGDGTAGAVEWRVLLPRVRMGPDQEHTFELAAGAIEACENVTHVRLSIYPDGGVMRLRVVGKAAAELR